MFKEEENHFDTCLFEETDDEETEKPICLNPDLGYDEQWSDTPKINIIYERKKIHK